MLNGIINIYKEKGYTSHDVVAKARGILRERKIGHTGTLDPEAEGVLPLCLGKATKVVPYLTDADKCYEAEVVLGATTTTEDATGEIVETFEVNVTREDIQKVVASFVGTYCQVPPMYSAIKINGVRLYEFARKGIVIDRPGRDITIYSCVITEWIDDSRFKILVHCSKGTYIRTLCTDIGAKLGCGAHMGSLLRTKVGSYTLEESITLSQLEECKSQVESYIKDLETIFKDYPKAVVKKRAERLLYNGNSLSENSVEGLNIGEQTSLIRVYDTSNTFIALYKWNSEKQALQVERMFL